MAPSRGKRGACLVREHRASEGEVVFQSLLATQPNTSEALNLLAWAETAGGKPQAAAEHLRRAIEIDPQNECNYVDLASLCIEHGMWDTAKEIVNVSLARIPASPRLHALQGVVDAQFGKYDDAANEFDRANELDPVNRLGAVGLSQLYAERNRPERAVDILRDRLQTSPDDPTLKYLLADALTKNAADDPARITEARRALQKAVHAKPDFGEAHALLVYCHINL